MEGNFKGFAMLRQMTLNQQDRLLPGWDSGAKPQPVYIEVRLHRGKGSSQFLRLELRSTNLVLLLPAGVRLRSTVPGELLEAPWHICCARGQSSGGFQ